jgi:hypothetical protein
MQMRGKKRSESISLQVNLLDETETSFRDLVGKKSLHNIVRMAFDDRLLLREMLCLPLPFLMEGLNSLLLFHYSSFVTPDLVCSSS